VSVAPGARRHRLAVVIGSGGVKCAAALGLRQVLEREGIPIDMYVGCSAGSIYAATAALGFSTEEARQATLQLWTRDVTARRRRGALLQLLMPKRFGFNERFGMRDDRVVLERLRAGFGARTFADARTVLHVAATDFRTGEQVVISRGSIVDAVRASIAIPFVLPAWPVDGRLLVDGFLSDPLPVNIAMREGADVILALGFDSPMQSRLTSPVRFVFQISTIMTNNLLRSRYAFHSQVHHSEVIAVIPEFRDRIGLFATEKIPRIIEDGAKATEAHLPYIKRLLAGEAG
jgi:NTE family protein